MSTEHEKEMNALALTAVIEKGIKVCIDDIDTHPQGSIMERIEAHNKFHLHSHYARKVIPDWNIKAEVRESRFMVKPLVDLLRNCIKEIDPSDPETLNVKSYNFMHRVLKNIREKETTRSINGSIRYGALNSQLRHRHNV